MNEEVDQISLQVVSDTLKKENDIVVTKTRENNGFLYLAAFISR